MRCLTRLLMTIRMRMGTTSSVTTMYVLCWTITTMRLER